MSAGAAPSEPSTKKAKKRPAPVDSDVDAGNSSVPGQPPEVQGGGGAAGENGKEQAPGEDAMLGKRGEAGDGSQPKKKKRRLAGPAEPKNALVHLHELRPGTQFTFVSQTGPVHAPVFVMAVEVNQQVFQGQGNTKKLAKLKAAEKALKSFLQFPDASEAHQLLGRGFLPSTADFTSDADVCSSGACNNLFSDFSGIAGGAAQAGGGGGGGGDGAAGNGSSADGDVPMGPEEPSDIDIMVAAHKRLVTSNTSNKNPVMMLNEIHRNVKYDMLGEVGQNHFRLFNMKVTVGSREFTGSGRSKKLAKTNAALNALKVLHGINQFKCRGNLKAFLALHQYHTVVE
ncbi:double-stranded RNA-specific editase 1 [Elysia marginata]|uniref:Double-stranded RNA-specific editase 1 n=1 Tax=Elysia marginata TaxID=1093978 RepID=A0AAV4IF31_9GAST|nr:double-stranded RNA-specific editase 1 [Elysia marginata]